MYCLVFIPNTPSICWKATSGVAYGVVIHVIILQILINNRKESCEWQGLVLRDLSNAVLSNHRIVRYIATRLATCGPIMSLKLVIRKYINHSLRYERIYRVLLGFFGYGFDKEIRYTITRRATVMWL
jgi:hypothetical protein